MEKYHTKNTNIRTTRLKTKQFLFKKPNSTQVWLDSNTQRRNLIRFLLKGNFKFRIEDSAV